MLAPDPATSVPSAGPAPRASWIVAVSGFLFILLQSACAAVMAISGLRLLIGIGSLAAATTSLRVLIGIHADRIRVPMELVAIAGVALNLYSLWRIRSLRARPASQWRVRPVTPQALRAERLQIALALVTVLLLVLEWGLHLHLHGRL